jgi:integrase
VWRRRGCSWTARYSTISRLFYDFAEYERLVAAAGSMDALTHLIVLLGGEAGLRCGEMIALEWKDVDLEKRQLCPDTETWA